MKGRSGALEDHRLFVGSFYFGEEVLDVGVLVGPKEDAVQPEDALDRQPMTVKLACSLVSRVPDPGRLRLRKAFRDTRIGQANSDSILVFERIRKIHSKLSLGELESFRLADLKEAGCEKHALPGPGCVRGDDDGKASIESTICVPS